MANNEIVLKLRVDGKGQLEAVVGAADKAGTALNRAGKNARTADRNLKGAAQASANGTKNFAKMAQGITGGIVPAYATLAANVFAISAAFNFLKNAADVANLESSQISFAQNTGVALQSMTGRLRDASGGMLGFREAAQAAAIGTAKGFSSAQLESLAEGALKASTALGRSYEDTFDRLVRGASKAEPELLDELGITLRLETATKNYAAAIGKQADALTAAERSQAVLLETQRQLEENFGDVEGKVNPFVRLGKVFEDLVKNITQAVLPAFNAFANFLADNAVAALAFFGLLGVSIFKAMLPLDDMKKKFAAFQFSQKRAIVEARKDIEAYKKSIRDTVVSLEAAKKKAATAFKTNAAQMAEANPKSKVLERASTGAMTAQDKANLKKALASAEKQYATHKKIVSGIFKGMAIENVRALDASFKQMNAKSMSTARKMANAFKVSGKTVILQFKKMRAAAGTAFSGLAKGAQMAGKAMNAMMKATVILGVIQMVYDMIMAVVNAPFDIAKGLVNGMAWIAKGIETVLNGLVSTIESVIKDLPDWLKPESMEGDINLGRFEFGTNAENAAKDFIKNNPFMQSLKRFQDKREAKKKFEEILDELKTDAQGVANEMAIILAGLNEESSAVKKGLERAEAISTLGFSSLLRTINAYQGEEREKALEALIQNLGDVSGISPQLQEALARGDLESVRQIELTASLYKANYASLNDSIRTMNSTMDSSIDGMIEYLEGMRDTAKATVAGANSLDITTDAYEVFNNALKDQGGTEAFLNGLIQSRAEIRMLKQDIADREAFMLKMSHTLPSLALDELGRKAAYETAQDNRSILVEELAQLERRKAVINETKEGGREAMQKIQNEIDAANNKLNLQNEELEKARKNYNAIERIGTTAMQSIENGLVSALTSIAEGTKSVKEAFADMAIMVLQEINRLIIRMMVARILLAAFGGGSSTPIDAGMTDYVPNLGFDVANVARDGGMFGANGRSLPGYRYGGIAQMAVGGVISGPNAGYPVMMHGAEAVVPLPDGKAIPVQMKGNQSQNNVVVNVSVDNQGNTTTKTESQSSMEAGQLGNMIAKAVQEELQNQKRSGGILNPYGVA